MDSVIIFCAKYLFIFVVLGLAIAWLRVGRQEKKRFLAAAILAGLIALALSRIAGHLYFDPRPFVADHVKPLIAHAPDNGFPSDHALLTMTLTAIAYFFSRKIAFGMLVLTIIVGFARVLAHVHSPLDIAGGWLFGVVGAAAGYFIMEYLFNRYGGRETTAESKRV